MSRTVQTRGAALALAFTASWAGASWARAAAETEQNPREWQLPSLVLSVVARDWDGAQPVVGQLLTADWLRPSQSSQMLVGRLEVYHGQFTTYAQLGLGYWRLDVRLLPRHAAEQDRATQIAAGIEWAVTSSASVAAESESTVVLRAPGEEPSTCHRGAAVAVAMLVGRLAF